VLMIPGFPDFWYTRRDQVRALASAGYRVAAVDTRGYNRSDQPEGVGAYAMPLLVGDVEAVIRDQGEESATVVGHDWGGAPMPLPARGSGSTPSTRWSPSPEQGTSFSGTRRRR